MQGAGNRAMINDCPLYRPWLRLAVPPCLHLHVEAGQLFGSLARHTTWLEVVRVMVEGVKGEPVGYNGDFFVVTTVIQWHWGDELMVTGDSWFDSCAKVGLILMVQKVGSGSADV